MADRELVGILEQRVKLADATERSLRELDEQLIAADQFGDLLNSLLGEREGSMARGLQVAEDWAGADGGLPDGQRARLQHERADDAEGGRGQGARLAASQLAGGAEQGQGVQARNLE